MKSRQGTPGWAALGAVGAAVLASSCCIVPVALAALGAGSVGLASVLAPFRPHLLGLTFLLLAGAFYATYRRPRAAACCTEGSACSTKGARRDKVILWVVTALVLGTAFYPQFRVLGNRKALAPNAATFAAAQASPHRLAFRIQGMTCAECSIPIQQALAKVPGVIGAAVSFDRQEAVVEWGGSRPSEAALARTIEGAGYKAVLP